MNDGHHCIETLWDARDVARYLKVSRSWVYQKAEAGLLPYLKVGGLVRFVPGRIRAFALASACGPGLGIEEGARGAAWRTRT